MASAQKEENLDFFNSNIQQKHKKNARGSSVTTALECRFDDFETHREGLISCAALEILTIIIRTW